MNRFLTQPHFTTLAGVQLQDKPFMLTEPLVYRTDVLPDRKQIYMPEFMRSDLATSPRIVRMFVSVAGWWRDAAWPHDLCCEPVDENNQPIPHFCDYKQAALVWREALENTIDQMDLTKKQKKRKLRTACFLAWAVRTGGPKFQTGDVWYHSS